MHSGAFNTTLNRHVHTCLQNHKSANQHFVIFCGCTQISSLQNAKPQNTGQAFLPKMPYSGGQHAPFRPDNMQEDFYSPLFS